MMMTVVIIAPTGMGMTPLIDRLTGKWTIAHPDTRYVISRNERNAYLERDDEVAQDFEPEALAQVLSMIQSPEFYTLEFSDPRLGTDVLLDLLQDPRLLVDNDYGWIGSSAEMIAALRSDPDYWDHASEAYLKQDKE